MTSTQTTDRRDDLLVAAADLFVDVGIRKATMEDIARRAGAGKATLYRHFANKDEVIAALLDREVARLERLIDQAVASRRTAATRVQAALATSIRFFLAHPILNRGRDEEPAELLERITASGGPLARRVQVRFEQLVAEGVRDGELRPVDATIASEVLTRLAASYLAFRPLAVPVDDHEQAERLAQAVIQGSIAR